MARRRYRKSEGEIIFNQLADLAALIPWWATIPTAILFFIFIPDVVPTDVQLHQPSDSAFLLLGVFFKALLKYVLPTALVAGAAANIFSGVKSFTLFSSINKRGAYETVKNLSWQDFEFLVSEWFKKQGYSTELVGGGGADGGIDVKLYKDGKLYLVQCKHYKAWKVTVHVVRELYGVMAAEQAVGGFVIISGKFTRDAQAFATGKNIELIDGERLAEILDSMESDSLFKTSPVSANAELCPKCGSRLTERSGKFGTFIGCTAYPKCRFTTSKEDQTREFV